MRIIALYFLASFMLHAAKIAVDAPCNSFSLPVLCETSNLPSVAIEKAILFVANIVIII